MVCSFCNRSESSVVDVTPDIRVCASCVKQIARVAGDPSVDDVWQYALCAEPRDDDQPPAREARLVEPVADVQFDAFKRGVAATIASEDSDSHASLAVAYTEMSLFTDALREASIALSGSSAAAATHAAKTSLKLLLTPPLLKPSGLEELRERLRARSRLN